MSELETLDMSNELKGALARETMEDWQLSDLPRDFYKLLSDWLIDAADLEREQIEILIQKLLRIRIGKITRMYCISKIDHIYSKVADE
ncbi:MAG: hypothetical protein IIA83_09585, partial [Thaumarchaeota archaeon]|nr:hypothetical protein [Nitrososphaerota archaeon]